MSSLFKSINGNILSTTKDNMCYYLCLRISLDIDLYNAGDSRNGKSTYAQCIGNI
jgi:hypothetical protein